MSENSKTIWFHKGPSSVSPQKLEKTETYLNRLLTAKESDPETVETINKLARELDENPAMAEIFLKKITTRGGDFFPWFLPDLNSRIHSKPVQKGIKRALYLFKQKGIELPVSMDLQSKHEGGILKNIEPFQATGYLSEFDGLRNQMVGLLIPKPAKGRLFAFTLIGSEGLESLQALEVSKREVKDIIADMERRSGLVFLEADFKHTAFILKEAHDRQSKLPQEEEGVYSGILNFLEGKMMVGRTPIIRSLLNKENPSPHSSDIQKLVQVPEIYYLLPEPGLIESHLQAVQEVRTGLLILNEIQKRERLTAIVDRAIQELFPPQERASLKRFLEEAAYLYYLKKQPDQAEALFYWANTMDEENGSRLGEGNPLLLWLMKTVLLAEEARKTPTAEPKEQISEGGIILPSWVRTKEETR
jgi:hypothetical protein